MPGRQVCVDLRCDVAAGRRELRLDGLDEADDALAVMALLLVQQPETLFGCLDTLAEIVDVSHLAGDPLTFDPPRLAAKGKLFTNGNRSEARRVGKEGVST